MPEPFLPSSGLYIVATPIGNARDITLRALDVLKSADIVLCEDTRNTQKLLKIYDFKAKLKPYHDHSNAEDRARIIKDLQAGKIVALVSDAGLPLVADPGYKLVREIIEQGIPLTSIPGANAALTALQLSALPSDSFLFGGFLPKKEKALKDYLKAHETIETTFVFYETANRLFKTLELIKQVWGDRKVSVARELTKLHEQVVTAEISQILKEETPLILKGEIVLCVEGSQGQKAFSQEEVIELLEAVLVDMRTKDAAKEVASKTGMSTNDVYDLALKIKEK